MSKKQGHIALFVRDLRGGGAERVMRDLANDFAARGYVVDLLLLRAQGAYLDGVSGNVNVMDLDTRNPLVALWKLRRYYKQARPNAVLATLLQCNLLALWARWLCGYKPRVVFREANTVSARAAHQGRVTAWLAKRLTRAFHPKVDAVIAVSSGVASDLAILGVADNVVSIPNPVDVVAIAKQARAKIPHAWLKDKKAVTLLAVGNLKPQKDYATMLRALALVREQRDARLIILGEDQGELAALEALAKELRVAKHVAFAGFAANPFAYMARADMLVLSSVAEGMPNVLIQAMTCGCSIVATDCPSGPSEILGGGVYGPLVPVGEAHTLAESILSNLEKPAASKAALKDRAADFAMDKIAPRYLKELGYE